jgi:hypothetical protein
VFDICRRFAQRGPAGLVSGKRGRRADEQRLLGAGQEAAIRHLFVRSRNIVGIRSGWPL